LIQVIVGQRLDIRSSLNGLPDDLLKRYEFLQKALDPPLTFERSFVVETEEHLFSSEVHQMALDFNALQKEIRLVDGFEYFGLPLPESELIRQAQRGPIVVLNCDGLRCDALIIRAGSVTSLALRNVTFDDIIIQVRKFYTAIKEITKPVRSQFPNSFI
jgi:hypothetical protein